jgi:hypothetical protein
LACPNLLGASYPKPLFSFALLTVTLTFFLRHNYAPNVVLASSS